MDHENALKERVYFPNCRFSHLTKQKATRSAAGSPTFVAAASFFEA